MNNNSFLSLRMVFFSTIITLSAGLLMFMQPVVAAEVEPETVIEATVISAPADEAATSNDRTTTEATPQNETTADDFFPVIEETTLPAEYENVDRIDGTYALASDVIVIDKNTSSDVFVAGSDITINATIGNDLFAAGNTITINGTVEGSVRLAANTIVINGIVQKNALMFANTITINENGALFGDSHLFASHVTSNGQTNNLTVAAQTITLNGVALGTTSITGSHATVGAEAEFQKDSTIRTSDDPTISEDAIGTNLITIKEYITTEAQRETQRVKVQQTLIDAQNAFVKFLFLSIISVVLVFVWPQWSKNVVEAMTKEKSTSWIAGLLFFFLVPSLALLLIFTLIGIPLAVVLLIVYALLLLIGWLYSALLLGTVIVDHTTFKQAHYARILQVVIGNFILVMATEMAVIGCLISILAMIWGVGAFLTQIKKVRTRQ